MNAKEVHAELERLGTEQNRRVYARHGVGPKQYGVSFANLKALAKRIKVDHALALELWRSGHHDARLLTAQIADPAAVDPALLERWVADLDNYVVTDAFTSLVGKTPHARAKADAWTRQESEWISTAGWSLVGRLADLDRELPDAYFEDRLATIERNLPTAPNRTRHAMNLALIQIGVRNPHLEKLATAAARRIGPVEVDHGETGCKTPEAVSYIAKTVAYRKAKKEKQKAKKGK